MDASPGTTDARRLAAWLMLGPLWLAVVATGFPDHRGVLGLAAVLWAAPAAWAMRRREWAPVAEDQQRGGWLGFALLFVVGALLRLVELDRVPLLISHDSGLNAAMGIDLLQRERYWPYAPDIGVGTETSMFYAIGWSIEHFGVRIFALRLPGALISLATLLPVFLLARALAGRTPALIATAIVAVSPYSVISGRNPLHSLTVPPVVALALWLLYVTLERGGVVRGFCAGLALGLTWHTFHGYRANAGFNLVYPFVAAVVLGRRQWRAVAALFVGYAIPSAVTAVFAWHHWHDWVLPLKQQLAAGKPSVFDRLRGCFILLYHAIVDWPAQRTGITSGVALLCMASLPLLARLRDPRALLLAFVLVTHIAPLMVPWHHRVAPRRLVALVPLLATLPAIGWWVVREGLDEKWRAVWRAWGAAVIVGLGVSSVHGLVWPGPIGGPEAERYPVLRALVDYLDEQPATAYVPQGYHLHGYFHLRFFFLDEDRLRELPENDPARADAAGALVFVDDGGGLGRKVVALYPEARRLELLAGGRRVPLWRVEAVQRGPARPPAIGDADVVDDWLHVPQDGRYRLSAPKGAHGELRLDGRRVLRADGPAMASELPLTRGLHRMRLIRDPGRPRWVPTWELIGRATRFREPPRSDPGIWPGWPSKTALVDARWRIRGERPLALVAAPLRPWGVRLLRLPPLPIVAEGVAEAQDIALDPLGSEVWPPDQRDGPALMIAEFDTVRRYFPDGRPDGSFRLQEPDGSDLRFRYDYEILQAKTWAVSAGQPGVLVACSPGRWVRLFDRHGKHVRALEDAWRDPVDVAVASDGRMAVADRERDVVVVYGPDGTAGARHRVGRPTSIAWQGGDLLVVSETEGALVRLGARRVSRSLGTVDRSTRVEGGEVIVVSDRRGMRFLTPELTWLALDGDAAPLTGGHEDLGKVSGGVWDATRGRLWVSSSHGHLERFAVVEAPRPASEAWVRGLDRAGVDLADGNLNTQPAGFGVGMAMPGGETPAIGVYRLTPREAGRYRLWLLLASDGERPLRVRVGAASFEVPGVETGGFRRDDLQWVLVGEVALAAGDVEVRLDSAGLVPHLARVKLEKVE